MSDPATDAFYERRASRYAHAFDQHPSRFLDAFLDRLAQGAKVLELGCGGGRDAARIAERICHAARMSAHTTTAKCRLPTRHGRPGFFIPEPCNTWSMSPLPIRNRWALRGADR